MTISNSGMSLLEDNDAQANWSGTDDIDDYNNCIQGTNSESWNVGKNTTETGVLSQSANANTSKYFTCWMATNLSPYYTNIKLELESSSNNYRSFTVADATDKDISGDFKSAVLQIDQGAQTGTYVPGSHADFRAIVNNSSSGNIRAVINTWIDAIYHGTGRTIGGTTASDQLFKESDDVDISSDTYDGLSYNEFGVIYFQSDVKVDTTSGNSFGETVVWRYSRNTDNLYTLDITDTADFRGTNLIASGCTLAVDSTLSTSFDWTGGSLTSGAKVKFKAGNEISGTVFTGCDSIDPNGATIDGITITDTTESSTGAMEFTDASHISNVSNIQLKNFAGKYGIYIPASITGTISLNGFISDDSGTADIYWAGTGGTLTVNMSGGTNFTTTASGGGTVSLENSVSLTINAPVSLNGAEIRIYDLDNSPAGSLGTELSGVESHSAATYVYSGTGGNSIWIQIMLDGYVEFGQQLTMPSSDGNFTALLKADLNS